MTVTLENERLRVEVSTHGAEIVSVYDKRRCYERVWTGDEAWWKRHTPVLFPIVGTIWQDTMRHRGKEYHMSQHGFARDMEFELVKADATKAEFKLTSTEETLKVYPFAFELYITQEISADGTVSTLWRVVNPGSEDMYFQIGGHPAYLLPGYPDVEDGCVLKVSGGKRPYKLTKIERGACVGLGETYFDGDEIKVSAHTFDGDAFIFESPCPTTTTLYDLAGEKYLEFRSECPALGIWAPHKGELAPFVCIEPWWGRADRVDYTGEYSQREYIQHLAPGASASGKWEVTF